MRWLRHPVMLTLVVLLAASLPAGFDPTPEELEQNRLKLAKWQTDPKRYARLRHDLGDFLSLDRARQERLRRLDHLLHREKPALQAHLYEVMERYADWLDRLPPAERQQLKATRDWRQRLRLIRQLRERQWLKHLPRAIRERLQKTQGPERDRLLAQLRQREQKRRQEWRIAFRRWEELLKKRPGKKDKEVQTFIAEYLRPRLSPEEQQQLDRLADRPGRFLKVLVELADRYPMALPGPRGPTHFEELPRAVRKLLPQLARLPKPLQNAEGKWPRYGSLVATLAARRQVKLPYELWPAHYHDLSPPVRQFLDRKLRRVLDDQEKEQLEASQGKWPAYPLTLQNLARKHHLQVPWQTLPGPRERWDLFRGKATAALPVLPRQMLRQFVFLELTPRERARLRHSGPEAASWERLTEEYFKRKPHELKRWEQGKKRNRK